MLVGWSPLRGAADGGFTSHDPAARLAVCYLPPSELTTGGQQQPCAAADNTQPPATLFTGCGHNIRLLVGAGREGESAKTDADMKAQPPEKDDRVSRCRRAKEG